MERDLAEGGEAAGQRLPGQGLRSDQHRVHGSIRQPQNSTGKDIFWIALSSLIFIVKRVVCPNFVIHCHKQNYHNSKA